MQRVNVIFMIYTEGFRVVPEGNFSGSCERRLRTPGHCALHCEGHPVERDTVVKRGGWDCGYSGGQVEIFDYVGIECNVGISGPCRGEISPWDTLWPVAHCALWRYSPREPQCARTVPRRVGLTARGERLDRLHHSCEDTLEFWLIDRKAQRG